VHDLIGRNRNRTVAVRFEESRPQIPEQKNSELIVNWVNANLKRNPFKINIRSQFLKPRQTVGTCTQVSRKPSDLTPPPNLAKQTGSPDLKVSIVVLELTCSSKNPSFSRYFDCKRASKICRIWENRKFGGWISGEGAPVSQAVISKSNVSSVKQTSPDFDQSSLPVNEIFSRSA
jgi:hypothetical protein